MKIERNQMTQDKIDSRIGGLDLVMLTYNREDTMERALRSVSGIDFNSVICVDHYSTDKSVNIIRQYFPSVKIFYEKGGLGFARTLAIREVRSPFFLFLDSDVVLPETFLSSVSKFLGKSVGAIQGKRHVNDPFWGKIIEARTPKVGYRIMRSHDRPFTGATLIRTRAVQGANVSQYKMMEDYFLMRYLQKNGYLWLEAFVPVQTLQSHTQTYGNMQTRTDENEGAAMRLYEIKSPSLFVREQIKYTVRDLFYAIELGKLSYVIYVLRIHRNFVKGYISPAKYFS
jgi:glycosyltransferase involved in cell wall biosynthesis